MVKKKRGKKVTKVDRLAKELKPRPKKAFSIGGTGASLTKRTKIDIEMGFEYRKRLKVPPVRGIKVLEKKEFKDLLKEGRTKRPMYRRIDEIPMTKEEFKQKLLDGDFLTRRGRLTITERRIAAMEYLEQQEERWWIQQQMGLMYHFDKQHEKHAKKLYEVWFEEFAPKVANAIRYLKENNEDKLADELQEYFEALIDKNKPRRTELTGLRYRVRKLTLIGDVMALRQLFEELAPLKKALEPS